jgi:protein-S-isoprenylcysteine O-methyltransferase Ste14
MTGQSRGLKARMPLNKPATAPVEGPVASRTTASRAAPSDGEPGGTIRSISPLVERRMQRLMDLGEKTFCVLLFTALVVRLSASLSLAPYNALVLISDGMIVLFILTRRNSAVTTRPTDWLVALMGTALPLLVRPGGRPFMPPAVGGELMFAGIAVSIWAKLVLRRSFGLAAANRGVVQGGPYRFVRHPMYAGYLLTEMGFLLNNPLGWNAVIFLGALTCQVARIGAEERLLVLDPDYGAVIRRAPYRLAPGLF